MRENDGKEEEDQDERKKKKLHKYYKKAYVKLIGDVCTDLPKKYCTGCFFSVPPLYVIHVCYLAVKKLKNTHVLQRVLYTNLVSRIMN